VKICLVSQQYPPESARGGIGTLMSMKARVLTGLGHTVHVLSATSEPGPELRTTEDEGVVVHRLRRPTTNETAPNWLAHSWLVLSHLRALEQEHRFDLINFAEYGAEGYLYQLDRVPSMWTPVAVELHCPLMLLAEHVGWPVRGSDFYEVGRQMEGETIRRADRLLANTAHIADFTAEYYGVDRESIDVVHGGVDLEVFTPGPAPSPERPVVLFVGNVARQKGVDVALEAVLSLREKHPGITFRAVGPQRKSLMRDLQHRVGEMGAEDAVELAGFVADRRALAEHYRAATVVCVPSRHEGGIPNVVLEAMACGCPVVVSDVGGPREAVVDGDTGFLVPPGEVEATAAAIDRIVGDPELRRRLGERARRHVEGSFSPQQHIERVLASYERAIERSRESLEQAVS